MQWNGGLWIYEFFFSMCNNHTKDLKWIVPEAHLKIMNLERLHVRPNLSDVKGMEIHMWYMESPHTSCMTNRALNMCIALFVCNSFRRHSIHPPPQRLVDEQKYPPLCKTVPAFGWWRVLFSHPGEYKKATIHLWGAAVFQSYNWA